MIKPLSIGHLSFPVNIVQGPLAGISCAPFRKLTWQYSKPAFTYTEMISCKTLLYQTKSNERFVTKYSDEGPVCYQLSGREPNELSEAVKRVTDFGADLIDLNCGCPVNKIRTRGVGSKLLSDPLQIYKLIKAMKDATHLPVSIKIRIDGSSRDQNNQELVKILKESGADFLSVHGRHWTENYDTACHYDQIQYFVEELSIPVIGNGDIACVSSLKKMFATGCAGVMIARAGVGQPWLIGQLISEMTGAFFNRPTAFEIKTAFLQHTRELAQLLRSEKFAVIQARKFAKYYARGLEQRTKFTELVNVCENLAKLEQICIEFFG